MTPGGARALVDRELYIPEKWAEDRDRCKAAGIGDEVKFATKPKLAEAMIGRAVKAGVPFKWVTGDEAYGGNPKLREYLEEEEIPYVLAVACNAMVPTAAGAKRADEMAELVPAAAWQRLSCADGSKGPRRPACVVLPGAGRLGGRVPRARRGGQEAVLPALWPQHRAANAARTDASDPAPGGTIQQQRPAAPGGSLIPRTNRG